MTEILRVASLNFSTLDRSESMPLFAEWCEFDSTISDKKRLLKLREKAGGRDAIANALALVMRSHYDDVSRIAQDVSDLGYGKASALLAERMPRSATARSGELGEILATELVEEELGYWVPVRRLRYKDGREMALRGDDFIGIQNNSDEAIKYAKGESKSRKTLAQDAINDARLVLARDHGRPTPTSILFVADRLMDLGGEEEKLGRAIRNEVATRAVAPDRIEHILFAVSGNAIPKALLDDFAATSGDRPHAVIHLEVSDHQDFIKASFEKALKLGND
ncbi:Hachiman antiphage defense system protein HamA [Bradyrhizobium yuanmingense]|uniref:Hachiman antiphage defense system protein HamA n=1 Tax=Bradyrhizobium yuanmingense TaxID=108015 RepID=UPI0023B89069|nr:Hachiman antiphage defense system protein HamA [Bradyrhizobium yuanmingense]MDF0497158.1 SAVED domain-containing protein [Bradyrhizobium yuanmingense]